MTQEYLLILGLTWPRFHKTMKRFCLIVVLCQVKVRSPPHLPFSSLKMSSSLPPPPAMQTLEEFLVRFSIEMSSSFEPCNIYWQKWNVVSRNFERELLRSASVQGEAKERSKERLKERPKRDQRRGQRRGQREESSGNWVRRKVTDWWAAHLSLRNWWLFEDSHCHCVCFSWIWRTLHWLPLVRPVRRW